MPAQMRRLARDVRRTPTVKTLQYVQGLIAYKRTHIENEQRRRERTAAADGTGGDGGRVAFRRQVNNTHTNTQGGNTHGKDN